MFDSQKLSFDSFLLGFKHGVYVFTSDSCHVCSEYRKSIEYLNNANLYFVEVITEEQRKVIAQLFQRRGFPQTAFYENNELKFIRTGQLFEGGKSSSLNELYDFLKKLGDKPLSKEDIAKKLEEINNKCEFAFYLFPPTCPQEIRDKILDKAYDYKELPIDVDTVGRGLETTVREKIFAAHYSFTKLVIFKDGKTNIFSNLAQAMLIGYANKANDVTFICRNIDEVLNDTDSTREQATRRQA